MLPFSVCMITKNEENRIERCLKSLKPYGFEIVIVDTGSTDRTKEIASEYTSCIYDFTWVDDFSAARNYSLQKASNDWIFMMDCDEWIESIDIKELTYFRKHLSHAVGSVTRKNITGSPKHPGQTIDQTERFFNRKRYHYTGRIHEQVTPKFEKTFEAFLLKTVIGHDGYLMTDEQRKEKSYRNVSLLEKELADNPDNPYIMYQLGKGYDIISAYDKSCTCYEKALSHDLDPSLAYVQALIIAYGEALLETGQQAQALELQKYSNALSSSADYLYLMGIIYVKNEVYDHALDCFEKAVSFETANKLGANTFLSYYEIGRILSLISEWTMARKYFEMCGDYPPALHAINVLNENNL